MTQTKKLSRANTAHYINGERHQVFLYNTCVAEWDGQEIRLCTGGWNTVTTQTRMNQAANQFGLGFRVSRKGGWFSVHFQGKRIPFGYGGFVRFSRFAKFGDAVKNALQSTNGGSLVPGVRGLLLPGEK